MMSDDKQQATSETPPSAGDGVWPARQRSILDWLVIETRNQRFIDNIFVEMCDRLIEAGVPVARGTLHFRTNNPQWLGARMLWKTGMSEVEFQTFDYGVEDRAQPMSGRMPASRSLPARQLAVAG
jgi:adenylate cyclase